MNSRNIAGIIEIDRKIEYLNEKIKEFTEAKSIRIGSGRYTVECDTGLLRTIALAQLETDLLKLKHEALKLGVNYDA